MEIKKKDMQKTAWRRCLEKEYYSREFSYHNYEGIISLMILKKITEPLVIHYDFGDALIADNNYKQIQIALKNQNFWLTAMFDDKDELVELYFDVTNGNYFEDLTNPYFYDLFLDVVVTKEKEIFIVDEDELEEALKDNTITEEEYHKAKCTASKLYAYLKDNKDEVIASCYELLKDMK